MKVCKIDLGGGWETFKSVQTSFAQTFRFQTSEPGDDDDYGGLAPPPTPHPSPLTKQGHCQACTVHYLSISSTILMQKIHQANARVIQNEPNQ